MFVPDSTRGQMTARRWLPGTTIRAAQSEDAAGIAHVQVDTSRHTYRGLVPRELLRRLSFSTQLRCWQRRLGRAEPSLIVRVAESPGGDIVGFAAAGNLLAPVEGFDNELFAIYVLSASQGCGLGEGLFRSVASSLDWRSSGMSLIAWVLVVNPYRRFFEKLGGRPIAIEVDHRDGVVRKVAYGWRRVTEGQRPWPWERST